MSKVEAFRALHHGRVPGDPLVLPGPWDAASARVFAEVRAAAGDRLFVNARVDTFLRGVTDPERTIERAALYGAAGADCVDPIGAPADVLPLLRAGIEGPLNALARPAGDGPSPAGLGERGATRITFGPGLQRRATAALREIAAGLRP
ncbi:isocitrate lyase/phosphoenolpyruvate mutase family protein [Streptomyces echinoruber]|uniref:isocitrate lyase/phosphoenolpyruvate mutase family protein n=1 Tax=Streptomyces echinoruber TaxID=68898 RepID=UPI00167CAF84|nr:isocitrate lyase/phosphoenolpyruvate mutase family protein [Streptomyces echinoruber]